MAPQLLHVMGGRPISGQPLTAFLEIQQGNVDVGRVAGTGDAYKNVLGVQATVLPAALVHAHQCPGQLLEHTLVDQFAVLFAATGGVPVFDFIEAVQGCIGHLSELMQAQEARQTTQARLDQLTPREAQVFHGLIEGRSNKEIAQELDISPRTVEIFRAKVMDKMQASTLSALVRMGMTLAA